MAHEPISDHEAAERDIRELLENNGMPQPDDVEYRERSIVPLFKEPKVALVIELDDRDGTCAPQSSPAA